jgi:pyruvate dehydrogenase E2 component (dihydrolipoamide acetyltransferase)
MAGVLEILVAEGETVAVGTPIARLGGGAVAAPSPEPSLRSTPLARRAAHDHGIALGSIETGRGAGGRIVMADVLAAAGIETRTSAESAPAAAPAPARPGGGARPPLPSESSVATTASSTATRPPNSSPRSGTSSRLRFGWRCDRPSGDGIVSLRPHGGDVDSHRDLLADQ